MTRIAITGGIACGKSLAGTLLASMGWVICDTDSIAHRLYRPGGIAYASVCQLAGTAALRENGEIDRGVLGAKVFADPDLLQALNAILHPLVREMVAHWFVEQEAQGQDVGAAIVPLLFEAGMAAGWDAVICIGSEVEKQRERLRERGLGAAEIASRLQAQWPVMQKMKFADFQVWNNGSFEELRQVLVGIDRCVRERKRQ
ncbi:MAG: dephospho-CoA kinase [Kiritimatiellia bacterium]